jgi:hypothetical protein
MKMENERYQEKDKETDRESDTEGEREEDGVGTYSMLERD